MSLLKILLADDNKEIKESLVRALFEDYQVDFASDADEEIAMARNNRYALIITDNDMEDGYGNSGIYAIEQIRKFDKKVPIIFYTASINKETFAKAREKGANETMSKPCRLSEMRAVIGKYLKE